MRVPRYVSQKVKYGVFFREKLCRYDHFYAYEKRYLLRKDILFKVTSTNKLDFNDVQS